MNTLNARQMLKEKRNWWEATADHMAEDATVDAQSNFSFRLALQRITAIDRNERRLALGAFGVCERCGGAIEDGRLEAILDSECHYCAACASKPAITRLPQRPANRSNGYHHHTQTAPQMAYAS